MRRAALTVAFFTLLALTLSASAETRLRQAEPPVAIEIAAQPIAAFEPRDGARTRFGPLTFRGGLRASKRCHPLGLGSTLINFAAARRQS